jgi:hypothetical protein
MPPTPVRPARRTPRKGDGGTLEKGTEAYPAPARDDAVTSDQWSASPPSAPALRGHPHRCVPISGTAASSPVLWEPKTTRHHHPRRCTSFGPPSATPSSRRTDDDSSGRHPLHYPRTAPGQAQDSPRRPARSKIRQDDHQLRGTVHHTATRSLELCRMIVNRLPLAYKRRSRSLGHRGTRDSDTLAPFPPSPRYWRFASIKPQGPRGSRSSPATLVAPSASTTVQRNTVPRAQPCWTYDPRPEPG